MARTLVIGDIHGAYKGLLQCIERSEFNRESDTLISLGDVCDGWPQVRECFDFLIGLPRMEYIRGNHDQMALDWANSGTALFGWKIQGTSSLKELKSASDGTTAICNKAL